MNRKTIAVHSEQASNTLQCNRTSESWNQVLLPRTSLIWIRRKYCSNSSKCSIKTSSLLTCDYQKEASGTISLWPITTRFRYKTALARPRVNRYLSNSRQQRSSPKIGDTSRERHSPVSYIAKRMLTSWTVKSLRKITVVSSSLLEWADLHRMRCTWVRQAPLIPRVSCNSLALRAFACTLRSTFIKLPSKISTITIKTHPIRI